MDSVATPAAKTPTLLRRPRRELLLRIGLTLLVMFMPLIVVFVLTRIQGYDMFRALPLWNDENWWYLQYGAVSEYGRPLGYFGYANTHASVGTFGPWGMYPLLLVGTLARVFGWSLHAFVWYNFLLLAGASLIFILLAKPNVRSLILLAVTNSVSYLTLCYSLICMNEIVRYSLAIVLTGIMYRIVTVPKVSRFRFILRCTVVPLLLAYAICFYTILAAFVPIYVYAMLHRLKPGWRILAAIPVTYLAIRFLRPLNSVTCAPYPFGQVNPANALRGKPLLYLRVRLLTLLQDMKNLDPLLLLTKGGDELVQALLIWFCLLLYISFGFFLWRMHVTAKKRDAAACTVQGMGLFLLLCFWGGYMLLYTSSDWTFMRGVNTGVMCAMFLAAMLPKGEGHVWQAMFITCLAGLVVFLSVFTTTFATRSRFSTEAEDQAWAEERQQLAEAIVLDEDAQDPWANTVYLSNSGVEAYFTLPFGVGVNGSDGGYTDAKYVLMDRANTSDQSVQDMEDKGYALTAETNTFYVFTDQTRSFD